MVSSTSWARAGVLAGGGAAGASGEGAAGAGARQQAILPGKTGNDQGEDPHPGNHPGKLEHRHIRDVGPHICGDDGNIRHTAGDAAHKAGHQVHGGDADKEEAHQKIQNKVKPQQQRQGPEYPPQPPEALFIHRAADKGPGGDLGQGAGPNREAGGLKADA